MARIAGVDLPKDKHAWIALTYIYGIGSSRSKVILDKAGIEHTTKAMDLTEDQVNDIRKVIDAEFKVEGELRSEVSMNIKRRATEDFAIVKAFPAMDSGPAPMPEPEKAPSALLLKRKNKLKAAKI